VQQRVVIALDARDIQELQRILMDREGEDALRFLAERVTVKVDEATRPRCKPPFDG
jgi:hypothetical protein